MDPKRQKSMSCEAAWPSRFQFAVFIACQMPFRFGLPPIRGRFWASAAKGKADSTSVATNETMNPCRILPPNLL